MLKKQSTIHSATAKDIFLNMYIAVVMVFKQFKDATFLEKVLSCKMSYEPSVAC